MKVNCLTSGEYKGILTPNKIYDVHYASYPPVGFTPRFYSITGDNGIVYSISTELFEPLRDANLDKLLT